jgi:orotate phosphoribosyltransferase
MTDAESQLLALIRERAFRRGTFRLASGGTSDYYIDGKMIAVHSLSARLIGEVLYERTRDWEIDAIGGLETGAIPLTTAAVIAYALHGRDMEGFWVRGEAKAHGTRKVIEGNLKEGARVAIVDDVFTKGSSALRAVQEAQAVGCRVVGVLTLLDRLQGARELFASHGIENYVAVFTIRDLGVEPNP